MSLHYALTWEATDEWREGRWPDTLTHSFEMYECIISDTRRVSAKFKPSAAFPQPLRNVFVRGFLGSLRNERRDGSPAGIDLTSTPITSPAPARHQITFMPWIICATFTCLPEMNFWMMSIQHSLECTMLVPVLHLEEMKDDLSGVLCKIWYMRNHLAYKICIELKDLILPLRDYTSLIIRNEVNGYLKYRLTISINKI